MNSLSHILIGRLLCTYLKQVHGVTLRRGSFLYGSLLPDYLPRYKKVPHKPVYWEAHLRSELALLARRRRAGERPGRGFSMRLGVVCHFLADFFCHPHTGEFSGGSLAHIRYEWALHRFARKNLRALCRTGFGTPHDTRLTAACGGSGGAYARFERLYGAYLAQAPSCLNDVLYTLSAGADMLGLTAGRARPAAG
jgi:hypothetical protein